MITGASLKSTDDLKKMWVITFVKDGKKNIMVGGLAGDVRYLDIDKISVSTEFPNCAVPLTIPLMETLEEAQEALDIIKKYSYLKGMSFMVEPATDLLYVGWTMTTNDEAGTAKFMPVFFPKALGVKASSKEEIREMTLRSIREKIENLLAVEASIKKAV
jgi:hypothetical protein